MTPAKAALYNFAAERLDGSPSTLAEYSGSVLLIVNTASKCGFTPQYAGLESLFLRYRHRGFSILAFPCNQFGAQEPGSAQEIGAFCSRNFGVTFPMFAKVEVNGPHAHPLFTYLKDHRPGFLGTRRIKWNFTKFLVDRSGQPVKRFAPARKPEAIAAAIEALLRVPASTGN